jgi:sacsin
LQIRGRLGVAAQGGDSGEGRRRRRLLLDLVDLGDCLGARAVHVLVDLRTHPAESLLQPNLAPLQGPAVRPSSPPSRSGR